MKKMIATCLSTLALATLAAGTAAADSMCSQVNLEITNEFHDPQGGAAVDIKVVDFKYWDDEDQKWRDEVTDNKRINPTQTAVWNKNLEYVGGESGVRIRVFFKFMHAGNWSSTRTQDSAAFTCVDATTSVEMTID
jgi:hypothetical protein